PASDFVKIRMKEQPSGYVQIRIVDLFGRTVYNSIEIYSEQVNEKTIDCSSFPNGFYSTVLTYNNKNECMPLVISK
ncbi:MAG: Secretion system C-terminal sorting domain, partial [Bacteroidota bacterium]|nr:Secretion system C-terminal sorting domain [Bacteroidota bacterium]